MKRLILLLAIAFTAISAFAVTHANTWNVFQYQNDAFVTQGSIKTYSIGNDTIIDGTKYFH